MNDQRTFSDIIRLLIDLIDTALPVLAAIALLIFFWGLVKFIYQAGDAKDHAEGRNLMIWGLIALFVMVSFVGIVRLFYEDVGFGRGFGLPLLPEPTENK